MFASGRPRAGRQMAVLRGRPNAAIRAWQWGRPDLVVHAPRLSLIIILAYPRAQDTAQLSPLLHTNHHPSFCAGERLLVLWLPAWRACRDSSYSLSGTSVPTSSNAAIELRLVWLGVEGAENELARVGRVLGRQPRPRPVGWRRPGGPPARRTALSHVENCYICMNVRQY